MVELPQDKKCVYLYNSKDTTQPYTGKLMVDKDAPIMAGQTEVTVPDEDKKYYFNEVTKQWVDQIVLTYEIKADKHLGAITRRPAGYTLRSNETFTKPKERLYDPTWNGSDWVGISAEEYYKQHPVAPVKPSAQQTAMIALGQQVGKREFFIHTLVFEPVKGLRSPGSNNGIGQHMMEWSSPADASDKNFHWT